MASKDYLDRSNVRYFRRRVRKWFTSNRRELPWRQTRDPYHLLLAEFLLQQTDVEKAVSAYIQLSKRYPTVDHLARAQLRSLDRVFSAIGLRYRAERLSQSAKTIRRDWRYCIPDEPEVLMQLPGVGRYIAHSVCSAAFGKRLAVVDTNVARILERFFGFKGSGRRARDDPTVWHAAQELMSLRESTPAEWNWALLDFGALVCHAREPRCGECPVAARCAHLSHRR